MAMDVSQVWLQVLSQHVLVYTYTADLSLQTLRVTVYFFILFIIVICAICITETKITRILGIEVKKHHSDKQTVWAKFSASTNLKSVYNNAVRHLMF